MAGLLNSFEQKMVLGIWKTCKSGLHLWSESTGKKWEAQNCL